MDVSDGQLKSKTPENILICDKKICCKQQHPAVFDTIILAHPQMHL